MINNSPFDDHIKKQLGNYKPEVPPHIWENIMAKKEKRRPGGFLFNLDGKRIFLLALVLLATGTGILIVNNNHHKKDISRQNIHGDEAATITANTKEQSNNSNQPNREQNEDVVYKSNTNTEQTASIPSTENKQPVIKDEERKEKTTNKNIQAADQQFNNISKKVKSGLTASTDFNTSKNNNPDIINAASINKTTSAGKKLRRSSAMQKKLTVENPGSESVQATDIASKDEVESETLSNNFSLSKYYLDINTKQTEKTFAFNVTNINIPALNIPCPGSPRNAAANKTYLEVYGGPDYIFRSFNDTANSTYLRKRKESTNVSSAFSLGIRYTKVFNNALSIRTGINYSQINEKFKYEQGHMVQLVYMLGPAGDTIGSYATTGTRYKTTHNKYRTIDIPVIVGYEFGNGRLKTNINAGFVINAYSWQKGDLLDSSYQPVNITTGKAHSPYQFKTNVGLGFTAAASFYYKLGGNFHLMAEPYLRYNFSPVNKADITLKQKYTTLGLRIGLRIDF